jgi:hypothetical protein
MRRLISMTQGIMKAQVIQFWYKFFGPWIWKKVVRCHFIAIHLINIAKVFFVTKRIELNMFKEWMMALGFIKDNPRSQLAQSQQQASQ